MSRPVGVTSWSKGSYSARARKRAPSAEGGGAADVVYFVAIIVTTGPQYVPALRRMFGVGG
jgi:hypothetical protein